MENGLYLVWSRLHPFAKRHYKQQTRQKSRSSHPAPFSLYLGKLTDNLGPTGARYRIVHFLGNVPVCDVVCV